MNIGVPSLEFMNFQNDSFFDDLATAVGKIRQYDHPSTKAVFESGLEDIVNKRLKTSIEFFIDPAGYANAYAMLPQLDRQHPFMAEWAAMVSNDMGRLVANLDTVMKRTGFVNVEKAEVSGIFSSIPVRTCITFGLLKSNLTDKEVAAVILHELGHIFTYFYYTRNFTVGGFISTTIAGAAAGAKSDAERRTIYEKGTRAMGVDGVAVGSMLAQTPEQNAQELQALYINETANELRSLTGHSTYEGKCCEQLADAFAARFGATVELALALEKIGAAGYDNKSRPMYALMLAFETVILTATAAFGGIKGQVFVAMMLLCGDDRTDGDYDNFTDRVKYIKRHVIEGLKNQKISEADRKRFLKDIDGFEKHFSDLKHSPSIVQIIRKTVLPSVRKKYKNHELQKAIEDALYNETFVLASKFQGVKK